MDERRGLLVRRVRGEGCVDESVSSTSNDRFSAGKHRTFLIREGTDSFYYNTGIILKFITLHTGLQVILER